VKGLLHEVRLESNQPLLYTVTQLVMDHSAEEWRLIQLIDLPPKETWEGSLQVINALRVLRNVVALSCRIVCSICCKDPRASEILDNLGRTEVDCIAE
jgi:hypothetical protein